MSRAVYQEYAPPPALADVIDCIWTVRSEGRITEPTCNRVLPDGCSDLIFNFGDSPDPEGVPHHALRAYVVGSMTRALAVRHVGRVEFVGARFLPGAGASVFGLPAAELTDRAVALEVLNRRLFAAAAPVRDSATAAAAIPALLEMLSQVMAQSAPDRLAAIAFARLQRTRGALPIRALAAELGASERRLQRTFREQLGITPKTAARVARLQAAVKLLRRHPEWQLGRVALESGYYDQPHFNREFTRLTAVTPQQWVAERVASVQAPAPTPA